MFKNIVLFLLCASTLNAAKFHDREGKTIDRVLVSFVPVGEGTSGDYALVKRILQQLVTLGYSPDELQFQVQPSTATRLEFDFGFAEYSDDSFVPNLILTAPDGHAMNSELVTLSLAHQSSLVMLNEYNYPPPVNRAIPSFSFGIGQKFSGIFLDEELIASDTLTPVGRLALLGRVSPELIAQIPGLELSPEWLAANRLHFAYAHDQQLMTDFARALGETNRTNQVVLVALGKGAARLAPGALPPNVRVVVLDRIAHDDFRFLLAGSEDAVLVTGDQSVGEALSARKNIFYQACYHKVSFAGALNDALHTWAEMGSQAAFQHSNLSAMKSRLMFLREEDTRQQYLALLNELLENESAGRKFPLMLQQALDREGIRRPFVGSFDNPEIYYHFSLEQICQFQLSEDGTCVKQGSPFFSRQFECHSGTGDFFLRSTPK